MTGPETGETAETPETAQPDDAALLEFVRTLGVGPLCQRMGIEIVSVARDRLVATMPVEGNTQPYGLLHGGASVVLAETLGSIGSAIHAGPGRVAVGIEVSATHHRAARAGLVTAVATPVSLGGTLATWAIEVTDDAGRRTCTVRLTCLLRDAAPGA